MMATDDLLRKLAPLLPKRVRAWRRQLEVTDSATRALLERQIAHTAYARLRDPRALLLSLPPPRRARGAFHLGVVRYDEPKWPIGIRESELVQHLAVFGRSGAGKTNVLFHLLVQLAGKKVPFVFLDWKRTGRHLLPLLKARVQVYTPGRALALFPFNPFLPPPGLEAGVYAHHVVDVLAHAYTLGDGAMSLLHKALAACEQEGATPARVLAHLRTVPEVERVRGWKISAIRALESLERTHMTSERATQARMVEALLDGLTIVELDGLSPSTKEFLLPLICLWVYHVRLLASSRERLALVLVIEEAHHVLYAHPRGHETVMEMLVRQCRELGIAIIVLDQHPHLLSSAALGNTYTSICLNLKDPTDIAKAAKLSLLDASDAHHLSTLPVGRGVVKLQDRWRTPFLVDFPRVPVDKGSVSDERLRAYLDGKTTLSAPSPPVTQEIARLGRPRPADEARFLDDVRAFPDDGVDTRYHRLGISVDAGTRLKRRLVALGLVEEERVAVGRTRRTLVRLTPSAREIAGQEDGVRRESLAHAYWKRHYADAYRAKGYHVEIEAPRPAGGRVDVLATRASESVAIEVETGKSDVVENVRRDLLSGYTRVLVIATCERAWIAALRELERAGLARLPQIAMMLREGAAAREGRRAFLPSYRAPCPEEPSSYSGRQ
jgi:Fe2+ transport system protein FeoA